MRPNPSNLTQTTHTTKCIRSRFGPTKQQIQNTHKKEVLFPSSLISTNITVRCLRLCANLSMMRTGRIKKKNKQDSTAHKTSIFFVQVKRRRVLYRGSKPYENSIFFLSALCVFTKEAATVRCVCVPFDVPLESINTYTSSNSCFFFFCWFVVVYFTECAHRRAVRLCVAAMLLLI